MEKGDYIVRDAEKSSKNVRLSLDSQGAKRGSSSVLDYGFIVENSNKHKIRIFFIAIISLVVVLGLGLAIFSTFKGFSKDSFYYDSIKGVIVGQVDSFTPAGLFYAGFGSSLFFIPLSEELFFYWGISKGTPILLAALMINAGFLLAQVFNYYMGKKMSKAVLYFVSKKKIYKVRRFVNKHGAWGVFFMNFLFLPAPLLTFALGITKYNIYRLFFFMILGSILKFTAIIIFFILTH